MRTAFWIGALTLSLLAAGPSPARAAESSPLTLSQAVELALRNNAAVPSAEGREAAAWAEADRARAEMWPQLRLDGRFQHVSEVPATQIPRGPTIVLGDEDAWVATASAQQLLWAGGRVSALTRQADRTARAQGESRTRTLQLVAYGAERAFRLLLAAQEDTAAAALNLAAAEDQLRVAGSRFEARAAARFDVLRAEVAAQEAREEVIRTAGALAIARAQLLQALGLREGEYRAVEPPAPAAVRPGLDALLAEAQRRRPELAGLQLQLEAADAGVAAARAERWPTLGLSAGYQVATPESQMLFTYWSAGAYVSLPVLDGGRIKARCDGAAAGVVQAHAALETGRRQVEAEVRQARAGAEAADAQVVVAAKRLEQAEELHRLAQVRYEGGVGTATEVADAQASLARARAGMTRARAGQGIAEAALALAVGTTLAGEPAAGGGAR
jgi:outer membrane protein TolC